MFGSWYFETLYMQQVLGYSPLKAGLAFLPQTLLIAVGAQVTARLVTRLGPRLLILIGTLVGSAGLAWLTRITPTSTFAADLLGPFILIGLGMGLTVTPVTVAGTAGVPRSDAGLASGLLNTSRTVGASIGLAVLATLAADHTKSELHRLAPTPAHAAAVTDGYSVAILDRVGHPPGSRWRGHGHCSLASTLSPSAVATGPGTAPHGVARRAVR